MRPTTQRQDLRTLERRLQQMDSRGREIVQTMYSAEHWRMISITPAGLVRANWYVSESGAKKRIMALHKSGWIKTRGPGRFGVINDPAVRDLAVKGRLVEEES